jgi:tRNA(fMet)-specific endonuclease VapC
LSYILDTNACVMLINNTNYAVRERFNREVAQADIYVSSVVAFELWYGAFKSRKLKATSEWLQAFLSGPVQILAFDSEDAVMAGRIRAELESVGRPIGPYDLLIAGQALRRGMTAVTGNVSEFSRVRGLKWEDWSVPARPR